MIDFGKYKIVNVPQKLIDERDNSKENIEPFYWRNILFKPVFGKGNDIYIKNYVAEIRGLRVVLQEDELYISNSLHKFFKGNNYSDFTRSELIQSIDLLSEYLDISDTLIFPTCLETGINSTFSDTNIYLNSIRNYKSKVFVLMKKNSIEYGRRMDMGEVYIKAYNKPKEVLLHDKITLPFSNTIRLEIGLASKRQLSFIPSLADLKKEDTLRLLQSKLLYYFSFVELDECYNLNGIDNRDLELLYAGKHRDFWKNYKKINVEVCKKRKQKYKKICSERAVSSLNEKIGQIIQEKMDFLISN